MRASRRHHYRRLKKKRSGYWGGYGVAGKKANTPHVCSCPGCCNQRRVEGPTHRERINTVEEYDE